MALARVLPPALLAALFITAAAVPAARAQDDLDYNRGRNVSVLQRERPDYQALGLQEGGFTIFPRLDVGGEYTSNVFETDSHEKSDFFALINPSVQALSNWGRHQLQGEAGLNVREFATYSSEDELGWYLRGSGRLDVHGESYLTASADVQHLYLERDTEDFPTNATKPLPYTTYGFSTRGVYQANQLRTSAGFSVRADRYDNVAAVGGGELDDSGRNLNTYVGDVRSEYALTPDKALFVQGFVTRYDYTVNGGVFGPDRDATEYKILGGTTFDISALMRGEIGVGYLTQDYSNPAYKSISGLALKGSLEYFPTELTTLTFKVHRDVQNSVVTGEGGYVYTGGSFRVDHELLRNLLLKASVEYATEDFQGVGRTDDVTVLSGGGTYFVNHVVGLSATASWERRDSSGPAQGPSFDDARMMFSVVLQR